ncbi:type II toxin-antitoxin system HigB family toxin [Brevundimonas sp.]|uniref:type II toxin-antitoxin system HigB family toxin n=1 Tax=Brevundimonas sp. TaxID=1871086 RepID=UPI0027315D45|nr:type II toxin-antitoxin system HigB family toxin [Brevundimonas sp.]MDP1912822.1 type II toxin-antitoxin system HigB family toxin [Brevundimonas sp.]
MNVVAKRTLQAFWTIHPQAQGPLISWYAHASKAEWRTPQDIKDDFRSVDFVGDNRVIFDVGGDNYRLVARISYIYKQVLVKFVGTHKEYDKINPETI